MRNLENTPLTDNQVAVLDVLNDYGLWRPPGIKTIKEITHIKDNGSVIRSIRSLQKRGLLKRNPFLPYFYPSSFLEHH